MKASRQKHISQKRQRKTTFVEPDMPEDQVVNVGEKEDINWTEFEEEKGGVSQDSKTQKK